MTASKGAIRPELVSIVTPSLNMREYLPQTIESILGQEYSPVEYTIMDGGSTDGTSELLERYAGRVICNTQHDSGAAEAIHAGFARSSGSILGWLSADDLYAPTAIPRVARAFAEHPEAEVIYGDGIWIDETGKPIGPYPTRDFDPDLFRQECFLCQPAVFFRRGAYEEVGGLNTALTSAYDYDLWIRLARKCRFHRIPEVLAYSRMHGGNKTIGQRGVAFREAMQLQRSYFEYVPMKAVFSYAAWRSDGRDQFHEPIHPGVGTYFRSLPMGLSWNRRHPLRYSLEWLARFPMVLDIMRRVRC